MSNHELKTRWILGGQYFLYFGVMGIFLPFFNLYCYHLGFSGFQIGIISAIKTVIGVLFPLIWGAIADRIKIRKKLYISCNLLSAGVWALFLVTADFTAMVIIMIVYSIFYSPLISFLETLTVKILGKDRDLYGNIRVWGSVSFILAVLVLGKIIDKYSVDIIILLILSGSIIQAFLSPLVPDYETPKEKIPKIRKNFFNGRTAVFLVCAFLMLLSHGTYYGFFSIHLEKLGYGSFFIGISWALASLSEIVVMLNSRQIFRWFSFERLIIFSLFMSAFRWCVLFFAVSPIAILVSQILHAITYGVFHISSILFIDTLSDDESKTFGQSVNNAVTYGLGMMVGFLINGYFFEKMGAYLFLFSSACAFSGGVIFYIYQFASSRVSAHSD
ncbi:MAG: MFS transporter [Proteobacteria bacterium]|nr:MFS transporter [Pseudomonadota bacterium]